MIHINTGYNKYVTEIWPKASKHYHFPCLHYDCHQALQHWYRNEKEWMMLSALTLWEMETWKEVCRRERRRGKTACLCAAVVSVSSVLEEPLSALPSQEMVFLLLWETISFFLLVLVMKVGWGGIH